jgi:RHS repeat-associated protein
MPKRAQARPAATSMTNSAGPLYSYTYDRYGNRWAQTPSQGGLTFSQSFNTATNRLSGSGFTYDAAGNLISDGTNTYTYDADGNLIQQTASGATMTYTYNALNQQAADNFSNGTVTEVVFDKSGQPASVWQAVSGGTLTQVIGKAYWGTTPIESYNVTSNMAFFAHRDWVGTRRAITNATGTTTNLRQSLPFGDGASNLSGSQDNTYDGFTGLWAGGTTATSHAQFREYWNSAGRWLQPDPYYGSYNLADPQTTNRYAYALNNPLSFIDPAGLQCIWDDGTQDDDEGDGGDTPEQCEQDGGTWGVSGTTVSVDANGNETCSGNCLDPGLPNSPNTTCPTGPSQIVSVSATTNAPTIAAGTAIGGAIAGPPGAFVGGIIGSLFGVGGSVSWVPSTNSWYAGPTAVFAPGLGGGSGISANDVNVPSTQNANSIANGQSYSITFQPNPLLGSVVTKSPGSGPPVVGPSIGTRVPVSFGAGYNFCLHNCGC